MLISDLTVREAFSYGTLWQRLEHIFHSPNEIEQFKRLRSFVKRRSHTASFWTALLRLVLPKLDSFRSSIDTAHARLFIACLEEDDPDVMSLVNVLRLIDVCTLGASKDEQLAELHRLASQASPGLLICAVMIPGRTPPSILKQFHPGAANQYLVCADLRVIDKMIHERLANGVFPSKTFPVSVGDCVCLAQPRWVASTASAVRIMDGYANDCLKFGFADHKEQDWFLLHVRGDSAFFFVRESLRYDIPTPIPCPSTIRSCVSPAVEEIILDGVIKLGDATSQTSIPAAFTFTTFDILSLKTHGCAAVSLVDYSLAARKRVLSDWRVISPREGDLEIHGYNIKQSLSLVQALLQRELDKGGVGIILKSGRVKYLLGNQQQAVWLRLDGRSL
ncbi:hypothetical protein BJY59DRAFT_716039 [Rhodotorula toruloides]|uniref:DNA ligase n=1 Tax=Rhodotorula toruloides (strain NP11) TaxID=1130832 RepID=M7X5N1_RHOT1|nr:DNA ligase [Rhodotorula toruloides NP11]EMS25641.1 DNA ligase [Rhodotorula toruloides NP11]